MSRSAEEEARNHSTAAPQTPSAVRQKPQFSLSTLLLAMLIIAVFCAAIRWSGTVWIIPITLASGSAVNLVLAIYRKSNWRALTLGHWPIATWLALAALATGFAVHGCLDYNEIAGTDKTPAHIVQISAAILAGPLVGPIANSAAGEAPQAQTWTGILFAILFLATSPFLFVRRVVPIPVALICWTAFLAASVLWFIGAMISLAIFLS